MSAYQTTLAGPSRQAADTLPGHRPWHVLRTDEVLAALDVNAETGLNADEVARRAAIHGANEIREQRRRGPLRLLLGQFTDFMILVLIAAAVVSGVIGEPQDATAIIVIVMLNGVIGFVQEFRAERAVAALRQLAAPAAVACRGGQALTIAARDLVPGDIVLLEAGSAVPADLRLIEAVQLRTDEAALTGESIPVDKLATVMSEPDLALGDRLNMAYKGTLVTYGRGRGIVVGTGMATELGRIATLLGDTGYGRTPLQERLAHFGARLAVAALAICVVVFAAGLLRGESAVLMFLTAVSLAVAAIPEALPAVITISLALGARRMVRKHALIRRLPAVETLGSVTYVCADKTGTLTQNRMRVEQLFADDRTRSTSETGGVSHEPWHSLYTALALNNDALPAADGIAAGDPTEVALAHAAAAAGYTKSGLAAQCPRTAEIPFDADRKCMTTFHQMGPEIIAFTKGAPERLLEHSTQQLTAHGAVPMDPEAVARIAEAAERMAGEGLRVLALGRRVWARLPDDLAPHVVEDQLTFLGLVGMIDPPRDEAQAAVALCQSAGITPVMITGDHPATARSVAVRLGILAEDGVVMSGQELTALTAEDLAERVGRVRAYARVAPEQKIKIVEALQQRGEYVAMTGDGVNDAPALKRADIGVAMGVTGTDVAREAAQMVLLDDNFATIVAAIREGRRIFDNARKFIRYAVTCNCGEIWTIFLAPFLGLPIPLLPIHILWINLVTDGLPGLALTAEPEERGIMQRPPRAPGESLFAHGLWQHILWVGLLMGGISLFTEAWARTGAVAHWQTMVFTVLALSQMGHVLAIRSERDSLFRQGLLSNLPLLGTVLLTTVLQCAVLYVPWSARLLKVEPLAPAELGLCLLLSAVVFTAVEIEKALVRAGRLYRDPEDRATCEQAN